MNPYRRFKILLVDDSIYLRKALEYKLCELIGPNIELIDEAGDGLEAIKMFERVKYDIVFMDIEMPTLDGIKTTKFLKIHFPDLKIVTMSSQYNLKYREEMIYAGSYNFIDKAELDDDKIMNAFEEL
jgi:DNA-binding NarL/FixJ family response regulator